MDRGYEAEGVTSPNSDVILRVFCNSLLGSVDSSVINFEYFDWNNNSVQAKELHDGIFYLNTCIADGKRLINRKSPLTLNSIGPNPVTGIAVIDYTVIEESYTSINIIDLLGVNKKIIFEGVPTAGNYRVNLEPGLLPSGFYFLVIKTTNEIFYEKIIISE
jgi:hypothetical protein